MEINQLPPQSQQAEECVIGSCIRDNRTIDDVMTIITTDDFYFDHHQKIFTAIIEIHDKRKPIDLVTLYDYLKTRGDIEDIGGAARLAMLWDVAPTAANAEYYAKIVREKAIARRGIHICTEMIRDLYSGEPPEDLIARFESQIFKIAATTNPDKELVRMSELLPNVLAMIGDTSACSFIRTPLSRLNQVMGGFGHGNLIILAARPSIGKSALAMNFAMHAAKCEGINSLIISLEMIGREWVQRALACEAEVPLNMIRGTTPYDGRYTTHIREGAERLSLASSRVWIDTRSGHNADTVAAQVRRAIQRSNVGIVFIDYLQLLDHSGSKSDNLATRVAATTRRLKLLARETQIPIVCLCQLNREIRGRADSEPVLTDLRDSGGIEQDADDVIFLWESATDREFNGNSIDQRLRVTVAKQRNGPQQSFSVTYKRPYIKFTDGPL